MEKIAPFGKTTTRMVKTHVFFVKKADSLKTSIIGLIGAKKPQPLLFHTRFGIHTFGMSFPIDVVILDKNGIVVRQKALLLPNRIFLWPPKWNTVLELPANSITSANIRLGEYVEIRYKSFKKIT